MSALWRQCLIFQCSMSWWWSGHYDRPTYRPTYAHTHWRHSHAPRPSPSIFANCNWSKTGQWDRAAVASFCHQEENHYGNHRHRKWSQRVYFWWGEEYPFGAPPSPFVGGIPRMTSLSSFAWQWSTYCSYEQWVNISLLKGMQALM